MDGQSEKAPLHAGERAELDRLRAEISALRLRSARRRPSARAVAAGALVVLGCLLAPLALTAVWVHTQLTDTERFAATMSPLIREPAVQQTITDRVTDEVFSRLDIAGLTERAVRALAERGLPEEIAGPLRGLAGPAASGVRGLVHDKVGELVASPAVAQLWDRAIRAGHEQLTAVLEGNSEAVVISGGQVRLDLAPFVAAGKQALAEAGLSAVNRLPDLHPTVPITDARTLERARSAYTLLDRLAAWLPWACLAFLASGTLLARDRRRAVVRAAGGVAAGMLALAVCVPIARAVLVGQVPTAPVPAVGIAYDLAAGFLRQGIRTVFAVALVIGFGTFLTGPSATAVALRTRLSRAAARIRAHLGRVPAGPAGRALRAHLTAVRASLIGLAVLVFVFLEQPSAAAVLVLAAVLVCCLGVVQVFAAPG